MSVKKNYMYDVFVSFRGKDLRRSFADHLFEAFRKSGIIVFKDDKHIEVGERIGEELPKAIQDSKFHMVIFSKRYADSYWCLNELIQILECQKPGERTFYPIFYHVKPSDVRDQKGPVGEAFAVHSKNEAAGRWRAAMAKAANLKGLELAKNFDGHEVQFIEKIVRTISQKPYFANFRVNDHLVGMESPVEKLLLSLRVGVDDVRMIGITGIGGVGKTTVASVVFNQIANKFDGKSFVENVRERSKDPRGLQDMQKQILTSVFGDQSIAVPSDVEGRNMMKWRMPNIKVLVVLDDVNDVKQLEALAEPIWFRPGSRIIVTSRVEKVLKDHGVRSRNIHRVNMLSNEDAIRLHIKYAFKEKRAVQGYEKLSEKVVRYAAGLPLTIKTLSSYLRDCPMDAWEDAIKRLKEIPWDETLKILKISYDALEKDQKDMFLHVACLLKGQPKKKAIRILESLGFHAQFGLRVLEQKSLITFRDDKIIANHDKVLVMHDHLEEMGMHIACSSDTDKLLCKKDEIEKIVKEDMGTEAIRGIKLPFTDVNAAKISQSLRKMSKLCFLYVGRGHESYKFDEAGKYLPNSLQYRHWFSYLPNSLQFLFWDGYLPNSLQFLFWDGYPYRSLPKTFQADNLVEMGMPGSYIHQLWEGGQKKVFPKLRLLDLSYSKLETFDSSMTPNLEELFLHGCEKLVEIYISNKCLHLKKLVLSRSTALEKLQMHGECPSLKSLNLSSTKLRSLNLGLTPNLEVLELEKCEDMEELVIPVECQKLTKLSLGATKLRSLNLEDFERIARLRVLSLVSYKESNDEPVPLSYLQKLKSLKELRLSFRYMNRLPHNIYKLKHLRVLDLANCRKLKNLPEDLARLERLEELNLQSCSSLRNIPDCICTMTRLKTLDISRCDQLEKLPDEFRRLQSLKVLKLIGIAERLKNLQESISQLKDLKVITKE